MPEIPTTYDALADMSDSRSYVTGYFALDLDGLDCGLLQKVEGGHIEAEVAVIPIAHDYFVKKQIAQFRFREFTATLGLSMGQPVIEWIQASLDMGYLRKSGAVKAADFTRKVRFIREFKDALIAEITFPACDAASKEPAFMTLKFAPESTRNRKGDGSTVESSVDSRQKLFHPANFALTIDGLEKACAKVSKVDAISIKQTSVEEDLGDAADDFREPGHIEFPNLKVTLPEAHADDFFAWHEDFVINGHNEEEKHRTGSLTYFDATRTKSLLEVSLAGLGIFKIGSSPSVNNEDKIATVTAEMYCEKVAAKLR